MLPPSGSRKVCDSGMSTPKADAASDHGGQHGKSGGRTILIVDDEVDISLTFSMLLELHGYRTLTAANGRQALDATAAQVPDLVISDCMMPVMDGVELARRLRTGERTAAVPIILMSGAPQRHQLSSVGHEAFLLKPVRFPELLATIERVLGG
jgi:CheY-like chemotaxis protein